MSFTKITLAAFISASMILSGTAAMAGPKGPQDFQNNPQPKFPGPGPKDFKAPPQKQGPNNSFNPAFGIILGVGAIAAAAAAAQDDECWKEKHNGKVFIVCED